MKSLKILLLLTLAFTTNTFAQTIKVATAANLQSVINILGDDFKKQTGITAEPIVSSSGKLVAQISSGAPYDVFLSADMEFPQQLEKDGLTNGKTTVYALGSLVICSTQDVSLHDWQKQLTADAVGKIAIANAKTAPYGRAAEEVLTKLNLMDKVKSKLVYGESISQVNTYITTGVVAAGFTSQSLAVDQAKSMTFHWAPIDRKLYAPIEQGMVLLKQSANKSAAKKFFKYMQSPSAKSILKKYGYIIP